MEGTANLAAKTSWPEAEGARVKQIWAVGGGKGGVGKSLIASSLAISLARSGQSVAAIDLDLGGANLHTTLGVDLPKQTLGDFLSGRADSLERCMVPTSIGQLSLISGAQDSVTVTNILDTQKRDLVAQARKLPVDYVIFDLGAGTSFHTLDFFLAADLGVITVLPEPTSIENTYRFIKSSYYRLLALLPSLKDVRPLVDMAMDSKNPLGIRSPADLFREIGRANPPALEILKAEIDRFAPKLIVNQARTQADVDIGHSIRTVCKKYFGIEMDYVGHLEYDSSVWQAVRRKKPLMVEFPNSRLVSSVDQITQQLLLRYGHQKNELISGGHGISGVF